MRCTYCQDNKIINVAELFDGVEIRSNDYLNSIVSWAKFAEVNYLKFNDEVPLVFIEDEIASIDEDNLADVIVNVLDKGMFISPTYYKYKRDEGKKIRELFSLSGKDRVLSTSIMKYVYDVIGVDNISHLSYSYRINSDSKKTIFMNWNTLWMEFIKAVQSCTNHNAYDKYYVIKLDIKSFYDSINLTLLKEIMQAKSSNGFQYSFLKLNLSSLSDDVRKRYENAINYMVKLSKEMLDKNFGVPQGPAYARYLAELYLASLDEFIVRNIDEYFDFACRYVDDYYIFVKEPQRGEKLKDELMSELGKMYLESNDKLKYGILEDIKYDIEVVNQVEKYFVDGIDESTPDAIKTEAKKILNSMFKNFIENDDKKDFPFFLTHLWDDSQAMSSAAILVEKIKNTTIGRGSLFKHFYNKIATQYTMLEFYNEVKGLSRANLITSLMRNELIDFNNYSQLVNDYLYVEDLEDYEKKELFRLILLNQIEFDIEYLSKEDYKKIVDLVGVIPSISWTNKLFEEVIFNVQDIENKVDALVVIEAILTKSKGIPNNIVLIDLIYSIFKEHTFTILTPEQLQKLFNVISYATLFVDSNDKVGELWRNILQNNTDTIDVKQWMKFEMIIDLELVNTRTITAVLIQLFQDISYVETKIANRIEKEFAYYLFLKLSNSSLSDELSDDLYSVVKKIAEEQKAISLLWCCDKETKYYLDSVTSSSNIEFNNRVVLKRGNQILVRGSAEMFPEGNYHTESMHDSISMCYKIYEITSSLKNYSEKIFCLKFIEMMSVTADIINQLNTRLVNVFEKGTLCEENSKLKFLYSQADYNFVIKNREKINTDKDSVINRMILEILEQDWRETFMNTSYELTSKNFKMLVIPQRVFGANVSAQNKYFAKLCDLIKVHQTNEAQNCLTIHELEGLKLEALFACVSLLNNKVSFDVREMKERYQILSLYNKFYDNPDYALLYSSEERIIKNLQERVEYFIESVSKNLDCSYAVGLQHDTRLLALRFKPLHGELDQFIKVDVRIISKGNINIINVNDTELALKEIKVIRFDGIFEETELTNDDLLSLNTADMYRFESKFVILPDEFTKSYEISSRKSNQYDLASMNSSSIIKSCSKFDDSVKNIMNQGGLSVTKEIAEGRLIKFLQGRDPKYYDSVLEVISRYRYITEKEYDLFRKNLIDVIDNHRISAITLKNHIVDNNGFNILIKDKYFDIFERGKEYEKKLEKNIKDFFSGNGSKILAVLSDVGISGIQFINTMNIYLKNSSNDKNNKLHFYKDDVFKKSVEGIEKVIIVNCLFTDLYENSVTDYIKMNFGKVSIEFKGTKILLPSDYSYLKIHQKDRNSFRDFIKEYYSDCLEMNIVSGVKYLDYLNIAEKEETSELEKSKSLLILRHRSMPKYRHLIFDDRIFDYRRG